MTSETELQGLSRQAAECLPNELRKPLRIYKGCVELGPKNSIPLWLHESTEACTEIMVRVLWPVLIDIEYGSETHVIASQRPDYRGTRPSRVLCNVYNRDPLLAFRVAVLRALVVLKAA